MELMSRNRSSVEETWAGGRRRLESPAQKGHYLRAWPFALLASSTSIGPGYPPVRATEGEYRGCAFDSLTWLRAARSTWGL